MSYSYNAGNQLTADSSGKAYTYNPRGDLTSETIDASTKTYTWDGKGRLVQVSEDENPIQTFFYDPADRLFGSMKAEEGTLYAYDMDSDTELATFNQDFVLTSLFQTGADGLISSTSGEDTSYFCFNPHGDASLLTDETGTPTAQLHYDAWGNAAEEASEPFAWLGKHQRRNMPDLGLIKMGARFYDPETGRFISRDPVEGHDEVSISRNPYVYAYDDPVNLKDLAGKDARSDELRRRAAKCYADAEICERDGQHWQAENLRENGDRLMELAAEHDRQVGSKTPKAQAESSPVACAVQSAATRGTHDDVYASLDPVSISLPDSSLSPSPSGEPSDNPLEPRREEFGIDPVDYIISPVGEKFWDIVKGEPWWCFGQRALLKVVYAERHNQEWCNEVQVIIDEWVRRVIPDIIGNYVTIYTKNFRWFYRAIIYKYGVAVIPGYDDGY